jgi:spore coat protein A
MMSGERYHVIVDFSTIPIGTKLVLRNTAKTPFPAGAAPIANTVGQIMQFVVGGPPTVPDTSFNPAVGGAALRGGAQNPLIERLVNPATGTATVTVNKIRQLTLNEVMGMPQAATNPVTGVPTNYPGGPLEILVNNTKWDGKRVKGVKNGMYDMEPIPGFTPDGSGKNYVSETPNEGDTEIWEIVNLTADAHPIHLHLTSFQLMNRQNFDAKAYGAAYAAAFQGGGWDPMTGAAYPAGVFIPGFGPPCAYGTDSCNNRALGGNPDIEAVGGKKGQPLYLKGTPLPPLPEEAGWKDTVMALPGQVTRLVVRWAPQDATASGKNYFAFDPNGGHGYVWHCHIVDHEDNEMMRPNLVKPLDGVTRSYTKGTNY